MKTKVIAIALQKGGVAKTTTCINLGAGLEKSGKRVLLIDSDPQGSLSIALGCKQPSTLDITLATLMTKALNDQPFAPQEGLLTHPEGMSFLPANKDLAGLETTLVNAMSRETVLRQYLSEVKRPFDYILIDTGPSLGMLTVNALAAADSVLIPVLPQLLSAKGLEELLQTVSKVKKHINPKLSIDGILLTMVDGRTNYEREMAALLHSTYGGKLPIFRTEIPRSVRAAEQSAVCKSIFTHDPKGKAAAAYENLTKEVLSLEKSRQTCRAGDSR